MEISGVETRDGKVENLPYLAAEADNEPIPFLVIFGCSGATIRHSIETASSHEVNVRAVGSHGESIEKTFMVEVIDEFLPIVRTVEVSRVSLGTYLWGLSIIKNQTKSGHRVSFSHR